MPYLARATVAAARTLKRDHGLVVTPYIIKQLAVTWVLEQEKTLGRRRPRSPHSLALLETAFHDVMVKAALDEQEKSAPTR